MYKSTWMMLATPPGQDDPDDERDLDPQVERVQRSVQGELVDAERVAPGMPADHCGAQRPLDEMPDRVEEDEPDDHPRDQRQRHLHDPVAQLAQVIQQRHPPLGVLLPLGTHVPLTDDARPLDGTRKFRHDRFPQ
jgi:hypothetical protein